MSDYILAKDITIAAGTVLSIAPSAGVESDVTFKAVANIGDATAQGLIVKIIPQNSHSTNTEKG